MRDSGIVGYRLSGFVQALEDMNMFSCKNVDGGRCFRSRGKKLAFGLF